MYRRKKIKVDSRSFILLFILIVGYSLIYGCPDDQSEKKSANPQSETVRKLAENEYALDDIIDGDTIRVLDLKSTIRLLCVDTEETFKSNDDYDKELAYSNWEEYFKQNHDENAFPKYPTPFGDETKEFAKEFFDGVETVFLEPDSNSRTTGFFDRYLMYVFIERDGKRINYNLELVRNGYSPYYGKYGYSKKYHKEFIEADKYAHENKLGIWSDDKPHYPDYDKRIEMWNDRGDSIAFFEKRFGDRDDFIMLLDEKDWASLENRDGDRLTFFGTVDRFNKTGPPYKAFMSHKMGRSLLVTTNDENIFHTLAGAFNSERFIYVEGVLENSEKGYSVDVKSSKQIVTASELENKP